MSELFHPGSNRLLELLTPAQREPTRSRVLAPDELLSQSGELTDTIYFPISGLVSFVTVTDDGESIETGIVGNEGLVGSWVALRMARAPWQAMVQVQGSAEVMSRTTFESLLASDERFRNAVLEYTGALFSLATQTIACNRFHELPSRLSRWLLIVHDRVQGDTLPLTHRLLATMLGVHRPNVTVGLRALTLAGVIDTTGRGTIRVLSRQALEEASCECYLRGVTTLAPV